MKKEDCIDEKCSSVGHMRIVFSNHIFLSVGLKSVKDMILPFRLFIT